MSAADLDPALFAELQSLIQQGLASGDLLPAAKINQQLGLFQEHFGLRPLRTTDGEALLTLMHGREQGASRCLAYWLEFKNDEEFPGHRFGGIGGGSALKYGIFQRHSDGAWMTGSPGDQRVMTRAEAVENARKQRDELVAGAEVLGAFRREDLSDAAYSQLQIAMERAAPNLANAAWAHKYWFLLHSTILDDFHSPRYQRFHLFKLLQMPPDKCGILDGSAPRFVCAGRFISAANALGVHVSTLNRALNQRDHAFHRYWRVGVGTPESDLAERHWPAMRDGSYVAVGWADHVPDLTTVIGLEKREAKEQVREKLIPLYGDSSKATRKAGQIVNLAREMSEDDLVLACDGPMVIGVGRVAGPYEYDKALRFPHKRPVEWLLLEPWHMPEAAEGRGTTVYELGKSPRNILEIEQNLFRSRLQGRRPQPSALPARAVAPVALDAVTTRIEGILRRKGQVILYGPPGTGKTHHALRAARDLAARHAFRKNFTEISDTQRATIDGPNGLVRLCTFHPGYSYEDFVEGLRPRTSASQQMIFEPRDGIFKQLCLDAQRRPEHQFFLVIDEINRGDVPRVFGELMTLIELDKRQTSVTLPITGSQFSVPPNVFILGTMNTADRSISLLDAALRRRFGFLELMPDSTLLKGIAAGSLALGPWLDALNARLRQHLKRDARNLQIGHAYLMSRPPITSATEFARVLRDDVIPLLEEYCYDDFHLLKEILGADLVDVEAARIREELFESNREDELIQAVSFEQMESLTLNEPAGEEPIDSDLDSERDDTTQP